MKTIVAALLFAVASAHGAPAVNEASFTADYGPYRLAAPIATDGDTIRADVLIWPQHSVDTAIRVSGVDTPETGKAKCAAEKVAGHKAKAFTQTWISAHQPLTINLVKADAYPGRFDAVVAGRDGSLLAGALIAAGHGRPSRGQRSSWCP